MGQPTILSAPRIFIPYRQPIITPNIIYNFARPQRVDPRDVYHAAWEGVVGLAYDTSFFPKWGELAHAFCDKITSVEDAVHYANEALALLDDPYTRLVDPEKTAEMEDERQGTLVGIGVVFEEDADAAGNLVIARVLENGPADKAGLKPGDAIKAVDGVAITSIPRKDIVHRITGEEGTKVTITFVRQGAEQTIEITRGVVHVSSVRVRRYGKIAYVQLASFIQDGMVEELETALDEHADAEAYILGLRFNPGGQVGNCVRATSLLKDTGKIVTIRQRIPFHGYQRSVSQLLKDRIRTVNFNEDNGQNYAQDMQRHRNRTGNKPMAVLIDGYTASAGEMMAGFLKDSGRAILIGKRTYGKGIGQTVQPLLLGTTLIVTSLHYFTPSGHWAGDAHKNRIGIEPHFDVDLPEGIMAGSPGDTQLNFALAKMEEAIR